MVHLVQIMTTKLLLPSISVACLLLSQLRGVLKLSAMATTSPCVPPSPPPPPGTVSAAYVTCPNEEVARKLAKGLVEGKLAACVNIIPQIKSIYEWQGQIEEDSEVLMMLKTRTTKIPQVTQYVKTYHPYEVCEVISHPIQDGNPDYLSWVTTVVPE
uniref:CutA divalent cation tolerance homolog n=1 Tax=Eptatretus burgeri TaxID=7764 RepID=A0A8C4Q6X3_EPTBU